jgi:hypothetical protein
VSGGFGLPGGDRNYNWEQHQDFSPSQLQLFGKSSQAQLVQDVLDHRTEFLHGSNATMSTKREMLKHFRMSGPSFVRAIRDLILHLPCLT